MSEDMRNRPGPVANSPAAYAVSYFAAALIVYLPLEQALLDLLPATLYWPLRLLPDALIVLIATLALFDRSLRGRSRILLLSVGAACLLLVVANLLRGFAWTDTVNALRVLLRYVPLAILIWGYSHSARRVPRILLSAVLISGAVQVGAGIVGIGVDVATAEGTIMEAALLEDGTTGRYDRFGLFMALVTLGVIVATMVRPRRHVYALGGLAILMLGFSTSRQAMVALAVGALLLAILPRVRPLTRGVATAVAVLALTMPLYVPAPAVGPLMGDDDPSAPGPLRPPISSRGSTSISVDPNKNFRLFLTVDLAPWAVATEPVLGFGPRQHVAERPDPRLRQYVRSAGTTWDWARRFTNDSNYASMLIQFGAVVTGALIALIGVPLVLLFRHAWATGHPFSALAVATTMAIGVAGFLGPSLEIRVTSILLWTLPFAALAAVRTREAA